jgi:hypothetical protein
MKTSELTGYALDWAVAKCDGASADTLESYIDGMREADDGNYSTNWSQGGPIIEREGIGFRRGYSDESGFNGWVAQRWAQDTTVFEEGPTPLIAAMRCFVVSRLGDEIDLPEGLV